MVYAPFSAGLVHGAELPAYLYLEQVVPNSCLIHYKKGLRPFPDSAFTLKTMWINNLQTTNIDKIFYVIGNQHKIMHYCCSSNNCIAEFKFSLISAEFNGLFLLPLCQGVKL